MTSYVLGFAFWNDMVALIHKKRGPAPVINRLNGVGGHIEKGELPEEAMVREFAEETGMMIRGWDKFAELRIVEYKAIIHCYKVHLRGDIIGLKQMTDEVIGWYLVERIHALPIVPNLRWLVPLAQDKDRIIAHVLDETRVQ